MKITQNQNNNLLIIRFLCKFALRTTVQIVEGLRHIRAISSTPIFS